MRALPLVLALLATPALAAPPPPPGEARLLKEQGDARRRVGDAAGALEAYRAAVAVHPAYAEAQAAIGEVHYAAREYREATDAFGAAVANDPELATAWYNLGFAARKAGDLGRARLAYERYVALRPSDPDGRFGLAETLRALGDREGALRAYEAYGAVAAGQPAEAARLERARAIADGLRAAAPATATPSPTPTATATATPTATPAATTPPAATPPAATPPAAAPATSSEQSTAVHSDRSPDAEGAVSRAAAVAEKLAQGDRAFASADHRGALFAYQDAVYLDPRSAPARVKLGRAYLALRYAPQAQAQAEQALASDPSSADARKLLEDARSAPPRAAAPVPAAAAGASTAPQAVFSPPAAAATARTQARVYRFTPEAEGQAARAAAGAAAAAAAPEAEPDVRAEPPEPRLAPAAAEPAPSASQRYRAALERMGRRDWAGAVEELDLAIQQDPRLAVAYAARASARFGLAGYREAADDYRAALGLEPGLATPLYGLAECYRLLGDARAAALYQRYAESSARDVREDLRTVATRRAVELAPR